MIRHLRHIEIDKTGWDAQLLRCANRLWYAQSWVLDGMSPSWEALVDEGSGAIMPLTWRRKWGIDYLFQPYGLQQLGVFAPVMDVALTADFLAAVPRRFRFWDIRLNGAMSFQVGPNDRVSEQVDQVIDATGSIEELRSAYAKGHRRNLRQATDGTDLITVAPRTFSALFERTTHTRYGGARVRDLQALERVMEEGMARGQCKILGLDGKNGIIGAVCFVTWEGRSIFLKSANTGEGQAAKAIFRITDQWIERFAGNGLLLDFAGSNTPSVARFNAGFGARSTVYLRLVRNGLPPPLRWLKR